MLWLKVYRYGATTAIGVWHVHLPLSIKTVSATKAT